MYFLTLWNAHFFVVLFGCSVFAVRVAFACDLTRACDYLCFGIYRHSLRFKVTWRHLSLYFCQFSFIVAVNLNTTVSV